MVSIEKREFASSVIITSLLATVEGLLLVLLSMLRELRGPDGVSGGLGWAIAIPIALFGVLTLFTLGGAVTAWGKLE